MDWTLFYLFLIFVPNIVTGQDNITEVEEWTLDNFPNPHVDVDKCGRFGQISWICDPENILTRNDGERIYSS